MFTFLPQIPVPALHDVERLLLFAAIRDEAFAVPVILDAGEGTAGRTEVHQDPWRCAAQKWDLAKHRDLVLVKRLLVFLGPASQDVAVMTIQSVRTEFTHDQRLVILRLPLESIGFLR